MNDMIMLGSGSECAYYSICVENDVWKGRQGYFDYGVFGSDVLHM